MRTVALAVAALLIAAVAATTPASVSWNEGSRKVTGTLQPTGHGWPACDPGVTQMSGYFDIDAATNKHYFFWGFEAKQNPSTAPVILWMTGGPGCSSGLAILAENGPCHVNPKTGALYSNPYSWNNVATVIYIDQPAGVGFSYADRAGYDFNETMVANDMYKFMQAFYQAYPQYLNNDFFVYGESYGGHYAPATAHRIWQGNQNNEGTRVPLKGLSVGNGMTDPVIQFQYYSKLSYQWCKTVKGAPCVSEATYNTMESNIPQCVQLAKTCNTNDTKCAEAMNFCSSTQMGPFENSGLNVYDIRIPCEVPGLCYNFTMATDFMNRADVQQSLGVASRNITWQSCNMQVNQMFINDWMRNFQQMVPDLLGSNIRVLIYAGDVDFICNWIGNKAWTLALPWSGKAAFNGAQDLPWWVNEEPAGRFRTVSNSQVNLLFTFLQIHAAGHMVPMNQPERALEMVKHFLSDTPFYGYGGPNVGPAPGPSPSNAPVTSAPSAPVGATFTQKVCTDSACTQNCQNHVFQQNQCLQLQGGMSARAHCTPSSLEMTVYFTSQDCTGFSQASSEPLNTCEPDNKGSYLENVCSSGGAFETAALNKAALRLTKRK